MISFKNWLEVYGMDTDVTMPDPKKVQQQIDVLTKAAQKGALPPTTPIEAQKIGAKAKRIVQVSPKTPTASDAISAAKASNAYNQ